MDMSQSVTSSIAIGVISGVLTSIAIAIFLVFLRRVAIPWYQTITYSGINISGTWYAVDPPMAQRIEVNLAQTARTVKGSAVFTEIDGDGDMHQFEPSRSFKVTGITQDRFVSLTLKHSDNNRLGINCYLLEVIGDGRRMAGVFSFYGINTNQIGESYQLLYRDKVQADRASKEAHASLEERRKELMEELVENERQIESHDSSQQDLDLK